MPNPINIYNEKFKSCNLYVVANGDELLNEYFISGGFQYYGDYLRERDEPWHKQMKEFILKKYTT
ncbi:hypothetical protein [Chryseobacterium balustinum]|uniref:hypothetical protein n=1 Tax=Chryseobacterium balustinum TaxID=246 RepID=UPI0009A610C0|nr:hypothetical protein [Chryseobacterium balustinum]AZB29743.1 hypothetical protein EB354_11040 [Chryseobacterium balustinum]